MKRTLLVALVVASSLGAPIASAADPTAQDRALAESLFREGKDLVTKHKIAEACPKFAESQRLDPQVGTLLYLATCHEQEGMTASAWAEYSEAANVAQRVHQAEREQLAHERADAVEKKLTRMTVNVANAPDDLEVKLDGIAIGHASWGTKLPIDPGAHRIEASRPKHKTWSSDVTAPSGPASFVVDVPELEVETAPPLAVAPERDERAPAASSRKGAGAALLTVGAGGLVVGAVFGLIAISDKTNADNLNACTGSKCSQAALDKYSSAHVAANVSTAGFVAGIAGIALGTALVLTAPKSDSPRAWLAPSVLPGGAGASGGFAF